MNVNRIPQLSVLIPVYFGEGTISHLVEKLMAVLDQGSDSFEILLINDGSKDKSHSVCIEIQKKYPKLVRYFELAKNFGEHGAVLAGLNQCKGQAAVIIDDDFQNPPEEILKLHSKLKSSNCDVVYGFYESKKHNLFRNVGSWFNGYVATLMLDKPKGLYLCSFKIIRRNVIDQIIKYRGPFPYIDGLILRSTCHIETQLVTHSERSEGQSNYTFRKLIALWSNVFINFSVKPLRISLFLGFLSSILGMSVAIYFVFEKIQNPNLPIGWASTIISILLMGGIQLTVIGMVGEYIGRLYLENTGTPQFIIRSSHEEGRDYEL